jgi:NADPH:quinone reductase-like Zn-dependent oxidoreductase
MRVLTSASPQQPLGWSEVPERRLEENELRVTVRAVSVNPVDWKMRQGSILGNAHRIIGPPGPLVCGVDFAGTVSELGPKVTGLQIGDRVVGGTNFSRRQRGSYAEYVQVQADQVVVLPPEVSFEDAACLPVAGVTALRALRSLDKLDPKQTPRVLVLGASGGVGHFAVQLASLRGAVCVGVCSERNAALVKRLGGIPIDYRNGDVAAVAAQHGPFDVIVDAVGSATYPTGQYRKLCRGAYVLVAPSGRDFLRVLLPGPVTTLLGVVRREQLVPLTRELSAGRLRPVIQERIPLGEAERAHELSRTGKVVGKLVLLA